MQTHVFAVGVLGWSLEKFYLSSPYEFFLASEGYYNKLEHQAQLHRMSSFRVHQSLVVKPLKIYDYWPLKSDPEPEKIAPLTDEEIQDIINKHKVVFKDNG